MAQKPLTIVPKTTVSSPEPPRELGSNGRELWDSITGEYRFDDRAGCELLCQACEVLDNVTRMRALINAEGETIETGEGQPKAHPLLAPELSGRSFITRTLRQLGVTLEPVKAIGRPPGSAV
jgi:hypothetical protein